MGETGNIRGKLFGGFNRQDGSDYITALASERNMLRKQNEKLQADMEALHLRTAEAENMALAEKQRADEFIIKERSEAEAELRELCEKYENVRSDMEVTARHVKAELEKLENSLSLLTDIFTKAGERFDELHNIVKNMETPSGTCDLPDISKETE